MTEQRRMNPLACLAVGVTLTSLATTSVVAMLSGRALAADAHDIDRAVVGNALHILLHETGHMLVSELALPL